MDHEVAKAKADALSQFDDVIAHQKSVLEKLENLKTVLAGPCTEDELAVAYDALEEQDGNRAVCSYVEDEVERVREAIIDNSRGT